MEEEKLSLATLAAGKAVARFDDELAKILENIGDPNTAAQAVRTVTLKVSIRPDEERRNLEVFIAATSKMAPTHVVKAWARFGVGPKGPVALEDTQRQQSLFPPEQRDPKKVIDMPAQQNGEK